MTESSRENKPYQVKFDKSKLYSDVLRFILIKVVAGETANHLSELERISHEKWTAVEAGNQTLADELEDKENDLVESIINSAKR